MKTTLIVIAFWIALLTIFTSSQEKAVEENKHPNGCISCHFTENSRIPVMLSNAYPNHPKVSSMKMIPNDCGKCHKKGFKHGELSEIIHKTHDVKTENKTMDEIKEKCSSCHQIEIDVIDAINFKIKSCEKNW